MVLLKNDDIINQHKLEKIKQKYPETVYYISEISDCDHKIIDSSSRYGYYILQCKNINQLEEIEKI